MKNFKFQAINSLGEIIADNINAINELDAKEKIKQKNL